MTAPRGWWLVAIASTAPLACSSLSAEEQPAVIAAATEQSRDELRRAVSAAMNGQSVLLADDAFTRDSVLTIERRTPPGAQGAAATGRTLAAPERFRLVLRGARCVLVRETDGREWPLETARCVPAAAAAR
jgi:hypothetical protein